MKTSYTKKEIEARYTATAKRLGFTIKDTKQMQFNSGWWDADNDKTRLFRDRRYIKNGELFCLPAFDPEYSAGYTARMVENCPIHLQVAA